MSELMSDHEQPTSINDDPQSASEPEQHAPEKREKPAPASIGDPAQPYKAPTSGSVWGVTKDPSVSAKSNEYAQPAAVQVPQKQSSYPAQQTSPVVPSVGRPEFAGAATTGGSYMGVPPQPQQPYGANNGLYGSGFVQSLSSVGDEVKGQQINFGSWDSLGEENPASNNGVTYVAAPAVEIQQPKPQTKSKKSKAQQEPVEYPSSSGIDQQQQLPQAAEFGFASVPGGYGFAGMGSVEQNMAGLTAQYSGQHEYAQAPASAMPTEEAEQHKAHGGRGYKGNRRGDKGQANGASKGQQPTQQQISQMVQQPMQQQFAYQQQYPYGFPPQQYPYGFPPQYAHPQNQFAAQGNQYNKQLPRQQAYGIPTQAAGFPNYQQGGYQQYPAANQQPDGTFDYSNYQQSGFSAAPPADGSNDSGSQPAANDQQQQMNQQALYQQQQQFHGYPQQFAGQYGYPQHMPQQPAQQYQHMHQQYQQQWQQPTNNLNGNQ
jgi:hypothetical protein